MVPSFKVNVPLQAAGGCWWLLVADGKSYDDLHLQSLPCPHRGEWPGQECEEHVSILTGILRGSSDPEQGSSQLSSLSIMSG